MSGTGMGDGEPLNLQMARALGCRPEPRCDVAGEIYAYRCACPSHEHCHCGGTGEGGCSTLAPYGEDSPEGWACTGPLIERYAIDVSKYGSREKGGASWHAAAWRPDKNPREHSPGPCEAIARLVVKFAAEGRLPK